MGAHIYLYISTQIANMYSMIITLRILVNKWLLLSWNKQPKLTDRLFQEVKKEN